MKLTAWLQRPRHGADWEHILYVGEGQAMQAQPMPTLEPWWWR